MDFTKHDTLIAELLPKLEAFQDEYKKTHSVYFQALPSLKSVPTTDTKADNLMVSPEGKTTKWVDTGIDLGDLPFSVEVNEYVAKDCKGWDVVFSTSDGESEYTRSVGYGCEAKLRTRDWEKKVIEPK